MKRADRIKRMQEMFALAEKEQRIFTPEEQAEFDLHESICSKPEGELRSLGQPPAIHTKKRRYSLGRLLRHMTGTVGEDVGLEMETHAELAAKRKTAPEGVLVPLRLFRTTTKAHDGTSTSPNTGQALVGEDRRDELLMQIDDAILRSPIAERLGVTVIHSDEDKVIVPRMKKALAMSWIARDGTPSASPDAEFDSINMQPTTAAILFEMKRSLMYATHPSAEALLLEDARRAIGLGLDNAILTGTGASNQPQGLVAAATATTVSGAISASNAKTHPYQILDELQRYLQQADEGVKWVLHPAMVKLLRMAIAFTGSTCTTVIAQDGTTLEGREFVETYALGHPAGGPPAVATGLVGRFDQMVCCTFGDAFELMINPYADSVFSKGSVLVRGLLDYNQCHRDPKRVRKFTSEGA